jgi:hypothetical protein
MIVSFLVVCFAQMAWFFLHNHSLEFSFVHVKLCSGFQMKLVHVV